MAGCRDFLRTSLLGYPRITWLKFELTHVYQFDRNYPRIFTRKTKIGARKTNLFKRFRDFLR